MNDIYQIIRDSSHTDAHIYVMSKLERNCTIDDYVNKYIQLWKHCSQRSKLDYSIRIADDNQFDLLVKLLQENTRPAASSFGSQRSWIYGFEAIDWDKDFEPLMRYQVVNLSSLRGKAQL